jgi:hypothetical protein
MIHNSQATLITLTASGATVTRNEKTVFCGKRSVTYKEFYAAVQVGINPIYIFEFDLSEYESAFVKVNEEGGTVKVYRPTELIFEGEKFNIIRTFETTEHKIEVTAGL